MEAPVNRLHDGTATNSAIWRFYVCDSARACRAVTGTTASSEQLEGVGIERPRG